MIVMEIVMVIFLFILSVTIDAIVVLSGLSFAAWSVTSRLALKHALSLRSVH